ncbi:MAG: amidohydrolase family protein [Planctomycetes bacterium]|nr:amidohydrolase family protein [Planctomycetota bacterium]
MNLLPASLLTWAATCALVATAVAQDVVAVKGGKVLPVGAPAIDDGVVLIENGRIVKLGKASEVEIPWAAKVVDATGKTVMPTWVVAHSQAGQRGFNENMQNVPWLSVADAVDPSAIWFEDCLRNGVGTVHVLAGNQTLLGGLGMVVRPFGRTVEDMAVASNTGMKMSLFAAGGGRLQQIRKLRRALGDLRDYLADFDRRKAEFDKEKAAGAVGADKTWTEEIDRTKKAGVDLVQKKLKGWLYVPSFAEMDEAMRLTQDLDLQLVLGPNMDEAIAMLKRLAKPVVIDETIEYYETDEETQKETKHCPAKLLADAGIPFATSLAVGGPGSYPWWQIGTLMRNGVSRDKAIESLTTVPAKMLGLDAQVGSLAEGKLGNVQILTGDPLAATSWVETVILEGTIVYERKDDPRLQYLFQVEQDKAKKAAGPEQPAGNAPVPPKEGPKADAPKTEQPAGTGNPGEGK